MTARRSPWNLALLLSAAIACGDSDGKTSGDASTSDPGTTGTTSTTDPTTGTTGTTATDSSTTGDTSSTGTTPTTTEPGTTSTTEPGTTGTTGDDTDTTGAPASFERFKLLRAAGPCAPDNDCDGFTELLASGLLRVERFGEVGNPVVEVEVSDADLAAAALVFSDPALIALLDGADPLCNPPTDIFEAMEADIDGAMHDATTTACDQPPLTAARDMAQTLAMTYAP